MTEPSLKGRAIPGRWYLEQAALLLSAVKWTVLGSVSGLCAGLGTRAFLWVLDASDRLVKGLETGAFHGYYLLPLAMPACAWLILRFAPTAKGHGTEAVITAVHEDHGHVDWRVAPIKLLATVLTLAFGGSVGKEGPAAQIGAAISSMFADVLRLGQADRRRLVICGVGGGFAAVFGTPISGAVFGLEVLYQGRFEYDVVFPCVLAGVVANQVCGFQAPVPYLPEEFGRLSPWTLVAMSILCGAVFGIAALGLIEMMRALRRWFHRYAGHPYRLAAFGGLALAVFYKLAGGTYSGLGLPVIHAAVAGTFHPFPLAFLCKSFATALTLEAGGSGGIVTSLFYIGSTCGAALADLFHLPVGAFAVFGLVAVVAAATNTPIAACVMGMELLPGNVGIYASLCACAAYLFVGHRSVYPSQRLGMVKSDSLEVPIGVPMGEVTEDRIRLKPGSWAERLLRALGGRP